jgi:hypothetical protein
MYLTKSAAMLAAISAAQSTHRVDWCVRSISTTGSAGPAGLGGDKLFYIVPSNGPDYGEGALYDTLMYTDESCSSEEVTQVSQQRHEVTL